MRLFFWRSEYLSLQQQLSDLTAELKQVTARNKLAAEEIRKLSDDNHTLAIREQAADQVVRNLTCHLETADKKIADISSLLREPLNSRVRRWKPVVLKALDICDRGA